jgi:hypothetical protein
VGSATADEADRIDHDQGGGDWASLYREFVRYAI